MNDSANSNYFLDPNLIIFLIKRGMAFSEITTKLNRLGKVYTDVKGLQEVVYYYHLLGETVLGYENAMVLKNQTEVLPVTNNDIILQETLLDRYPGFPPRELLHTAVMLNNRITKVICLPESLYNEIELLSVEPMLSKLSERL